MVLDIFFVSLFQLKLKTLYIFIYCFKISDRLGAMWTSLVYIVMFLKKFIYLIMWFSKNDYIIFCEHRADYG